MKTIEIALESCLKPCPAPSSESALAPHAPLGDLGNDHSEPTSTLEHIALRKGNDLGLILDLVGNAAHSLPSSPSGANLHPGLAALAATEADEAAAQRRPHIKAIWLRAVERDLVVLRQHGVVQDVLLYETSLLDPTNWTVLPCHPTQSTVEQGMAGMYSWQDPWVRLRLRLGHAAFQQMLQLALPMRHRFLALLQLQDGSFWLCPWQQGLTLTTWLWAQESNQAEGYRVQLLGYGTEGLAPVREFATVPAPQPFEAGEEWPVDWAMDDVPLELIKSAPLETLG